MAESTTIYLIRHASSRPDEATPEPEWPLSEDGHAQARTLVGYLRDIEFTQVYASPFLRAQHTIAPLCAARGLPLKLVDGLRERKLRETYVDAPDEWQQVMRGLWSDLGSALPNCESGVACQTRMVDTLTQLAAKHAGETIAVVSHGNAIALFLHHLDSSFGYQGWRSMHNPHVFRLQYVASEWHWTSLPPVS